MSPDDPIDPEDPVDPVDPSDPVGPVGPVGPVTPVTPVTPVIPVGPTILPTFCQLSIDVGPSTKATHKYLLMIYPFPARAVSGNSLVEFS